MSLSKDELLLGWGNSQRVSGRHIDCKKPAFYFPDFFSHKTSAMDSILQLDRNFKTRF